MPSTRKRFLWTRKKLALIRIDTTATRRYVLILRSVFSSFLSSSFVRIRCVRAILFFSFLNAREQSADRVMVQLQEKKSATHLGHACARVPVKTCTSFSIAWDFVATIWKCIPFIGKAESRKKIKIDHEPNCFAFTVVTTFAMCLTHFKYSHDAWIMCWDMFPLCVLRSARKEKPSYIHFGCSKIV